MPGSALEEYSRNYGAKLRSALGGGPTPGGFAQSEENKAFVDQNDPQFRQPNQGPQPGAGPYIPPQDPVVPMEPGGSADPGGGQDMGGPISMGSELEGDPEQPPASALEGGKQKGFGFRDAWKQAPEQARQKELTKLEQSLKQANQTIDDAYDDLERQMGTKPEKKKKLSREEKGMLLMEFGLNVLANNKKGFGAIGEAGGKALKSYNQMSQGPYKEYEETRGAIAGARAGSKVKVAEASALESLKSPKGEGSRLPGRFTGDDGFVYFYDENGQAKKAVGEDGKPIKANQNESQVRPSDFETKRKSYLEVYGFDVNGKPLEGLAKREAEQDAIEFAGDRGSTIDDLDLDILAETSADKEMGADAYRDLTPDQREAQRAKIAAARRGRLKKPIRSRLQPSAEPGRGRPTGTRKFASEADAKAAFQRGEISVGDTITVNGVTGPVE